MIPGRRCLLAAVALATFVAGAPLPTARAADEPAAGGKIVVTHASGELASEVVGALLSRAVPPSQLVLVTRSPEALASYAAAGAEIRPADFSKPETLQAAFAGGRKLLLISPEEGERPAQNAAAISAARFAGIRHVVYMSLINATVENTAVGAREHRVTEDTLIRSNLGYTILRNQLFTEGLLEEAAEAAATGNLYSNSGKGKWAPIALRDCAAVAAIVLTSPGHEGRTYSITGPELLSRPDVAKLIAEVTGRRVRVIDMDDAAYLERAVRRGRSEAEARAAASFGAAIRRNALNIKSEAAQILLGRPPQSVRELLMQNRGRLAPALR